MSIIQEIQNRLYELQDTEYRDFQSKLIPGVQVEYIGVRTPELRKLAKEYAKHPEINEFLDTLPHKYFDENQLQAFIISEMKDYDVCITRINQFLPYVNNWATCDQMSPKVFKKRKCELLEKIKGWMASKETYTIRFAMGMLMQHYLDEDFSPEYLRWVAAVKSEEYYVNMMIAWYFATALAKQWEATVPYIENHSLEMWTNNKAIQKAVESYRITPEQKEYLKTFKIKK
jgi:3-methyladenine DNA glycosylase AlkD